MTSLRTRRFMGVIGYTDTPTNEAFPRILCAPGPHRRILPDHLVPVLERTGEKTTSVGTIYDVVVLGKELVALGYLTANTSADDIRIEALHRGELFMELDIDQAHFQEDTDGLRFHGWRVRAVTLGTSPCWTLPALHIWEV